MPVLEPKTQLFMFNERIKTKINKKMAKKNSKHKIANRRHPLTTHNIVSKVLFLWMYSFLNFTQKVCLKQEHHYALPKFDRVNFHKERVKRGLNRKRTIVGMILSEYYGKLVEFSLVGILCAVLSLYSGELLRQTSVILKEGKFNEIKVIKHLGLLFFYNMALSSLSTFISTMYQFRSNRLSLAIRSSILSLLLEKLLRLPNVSIPMTKIDPSYRPVEGEPIETQTVDGLLSNLFQIDLKRVRTVIYQLNQIIANSFVVILGYGFLINLMGLKMGSYIMFFFLSLNGLYCVSFYLKQKYVKKLLQKKD